ncbi:DUF2207 domain-containing protein [Amycolatopsis balhimycina DSM 5908]|uniref:DUF2207 domain-containing protein n=1 Tax=Amycolatopsis balhimycina DSM 5908 TaxID=1081091 RepID=A0A428W2F5_AMYBA|nr:DUF2207 domain-containing protein [Amycolatopsis balhimycina]RSM37252.1 DUF2207 domain-containing protein [Amycolatopsis balhimycina DSM 5908]
MFAAAVLALFLVAAPADQPPLPTVAQSAEIQLKVQRDGSLSVAEAISVPQGTTMDRRVALRVPAPHHRDRVYGVRDVVLEGSGTANVDKDAFTVHLTAGTSIIRYTVDGAVAGSRVTWELAGGWSTELKFVRASFAAPKIPTAVDCLAGPPDSDFSCGAAQIDHAGLTRFNQQDLAAGQRMTATVELPAGTVPDNAVLVPAKTVAGAFVLTAPVGWAWGAFGALLLATTSWVLLARRRRFHVKATPPGGHFHVKATGEFASPEGVLPGHVGVLLQGCPGAADLAATVLDLAVRNYLWVSAEDGGWRLARRNPVDEHLTAFERAVFDAVVPDEPVTLAELRRRHVGVAPDALYEDAVRRGWLARPPGKRLGKLGRAGIRVVFYGLFLTVLLALTAGYAQLGVIVVLAGVAAAVASAALPARRRAGADVARRLRGVAEKLASAKPKELTKPQRELVFSRGLPYALALGELAPWVAAFGSLDHPPPVYWHAGDVTPDQAGSFATALAGTFAAARRGRLLDAVGQHSRSHPPVGTHAGADPS